MKGLHENGAKYPTLILDEESDHSSLNTKRNTKLGSTIHNLICDLRDSIKQNAYMGYTATPQGVLLQSPKSKLFPEHFLWYLDPHDKYFGPNHFFNEYSRHSICRIPSSEFPNYGDDEVDHILSLENSERLADWQTRVIGGWEKDGPPESFTRALIDFVLTGAVRWYREGIGENPKYPDHSMIFHLDRRIESQETVGKVVEMAWKEVSGNLLDLVDRSFEFDFDSNLDSLVNERGGKE